MKPHKILLNFLSVVFAVAMLWMIFGLGLSIYANLIVEETVVKFEEEVHEDNSRTGGFRRWGTYKEDGFQIPIHLSIAYADTIFTLRGFKKGHKKKYRTHSTISKNSWQNKTRYSPFEDGWGKRITESYDTIITNDTSIFEVIAMHPNYEPKDTMYSGEPFDVHLKTRRANNAFDIAPIISTHNSTIRIIPKNKAQYFILLFRTHLNSLTFLFIFYQLFRTVSRLNRKMSFSDNLASRIKMIGIALILFVVLELVISFVITKWYSSIGLYSASKFESIQEIVSLGISGRLEFEPFYLITGLLLILLCTLMNRTVKIEEDWSLTI